MTKEKIDLMIEGGKATPNAAISQALGPLRIDIAGVIKRINEKTHDYNGMKIPVKIIVDTKTKDVEIEVGTPPISELIKKEANAEKGSGTPNKIKIGNLAMEQIVKLAKMKYEGMHVNNMKSAVKSVIGSGHSAGVLVEGKSAQEINVEIDKGIYDDIINHIKTEVPEEKKLLLANQLKEFQEKVQKEIEKAAKEAAAKEAAEAKSKEETVVAKEGEAPKEGAPAAATSKEKGKESAPAAGKAATGKPAAGKPAKEEKKK